MSLPRNIAIRRESIAKLMPPTALSFFVGTSPMAAHSVGLFLVNSAFLKHDDDITGGAYE